MNVYVRTLSCVALLGMALAGLSQYRPAWAARYSLDWWTIPELDEEMRRDEQRLVEMGAANEAALPRIEAKGAVIHDLRAGRLTLAQAATRFRRLNVPADGPPTHLSRHFDGATEEERLCRQVITWAQADTPDNPPGAGEQVRERLEAELGRLLAENNGTVRLAE